MTLGPELSAADAAAFDASAVPNYLAYFGALVLEMVLPSQRAAIAQVGARTGYPAAALAERLPGSYLCGVDASAPAIEFARGAAAQLPAFDARYEIAEGLPTRLSEASFTHSIALCPVGDAVARGAVFRELARVLLPGGQALVALPLRGSFPELADMLREFGTKRGLSDFDKAVEAMAPARPTIESLADELAEAGLCEIDVDVQLVTIPFGSGREFLDDPVARWCVWPDVTSVLDVEPALRGEAVAYAHEAIAKYWSEGGFELTVNVGSASARR